MTTEITITDLKAEIVGKARPVVKVSVKLYCDLLEKKARQDERNTLRNGIESGYTCVKAGCKGEAAACVECINKELEKARQDEAKKIFEFIEAEIKNEIYPDEYHESPLWKRVKKKFGVK